jgi:hypothetical protein
VEQVEESVFLRGGVLEQMAAAGAPRSNQLNEAYIVDLSLRREQVRVFDLSRR